MSRGGHRIPTKAISEPHRRAARALAQMGTTTKVATAMCGCRCHHGHTRAHPDEKCRCRGGDGFMAMPTEQTYKIRLSRRVLFFLEGTQAWAVRNDPDDPDYVDVIVTALNAHRRKDGSAVVICTAKEAVELMVRGDDLAVSAGDGASDMSMGVGDFSQADSLADLNAGRALVEQVHRVVPGERIREIMSDWLR